MEPKDLREEEIIVKQKIVIRYNNESARKKCLDKILEGTNWIAFSEGWQKGKEEKYSAGKREVIEIIEPNPEKLRVICTMGSRGNAIGLDRDFLSYSTLQFGDEIIRTKGLLHKADPTTFLYETEDSHNLDIGSVLFSLGKRSDL